MARASMNHREYVGGMWDEIGRLQFNFMIGRGLKPADYVLDMGCGSLRAGRHLIEYLEPGRYVGFDHHSWLVGDGIGKELSGRLMGEKVPSFVINDNFDLGCLKLNIDFVIAHSLFTHLKPTDIIRCLISLKNISPGVVYATFNECARHDESDNPPESDDHEVFRYGPKTMRGFAESAGFRFRFIGDWGHPRRQVMAEMRP